MARPRGGVNKSQMIREYLRENPGVRTKDVVEHFVSLGMEVSNQLVSTVRSKEGVSGGSSEVRLSEVRSVREFVERSELDAEVAVQILTSFADLVDNLGGTGRFRRVLTAYIECVDPSSEEDSSEEDHEEDRGTGSSYIDVNEEEED